MTPEQSTMLIVYQWVFPVLIGVIGFIGALGVKALIDMRKTLNEINVHISVATAKHDSLQENHESLEARHDRLEGRVLQLETKKK